MDKTYVRIIWQNQPSTATALGATNLNKMDYAINAIDDRVVAMDTSKANQSTVNNTIQSVALNEATGVLTFTKVNSTSIDIDTKLEKLAINFEYDPVNQQLVITLDDGTKQYIDMSALITQYEFLDTDTVSFSVQPDGKIKANIVPGSITADMLQPNYLADIIVQAQNAANSSGAAAVSEANAKSYMEQAQNAVQLAQEYSDIVYPNLYIDLNTGRLMSVGGQNISFSINSNGHLISEVIF